MSYDDFLFYLPAFGSIFIAAASALVAWLVWRILTARKKRKAVEKSQKT